MNDRGGASTSMKIFEAQPWYSRILNPYIVRAERRWLGGRPTYFIARCSTQ